MITRYFVALGVYVSRALYQSINIVRLIIAELGKIKELINYVTDPTKIHNELGWLSKTKFEDALRKRSSDIWRITSGEKKSSAANTRITTRRCMGIGDNMYDYLIIGSGIL